VGTLDLIMPQKASSQVDVNYQGNLQFSGAGNIWVTEGKSLVLNGGNLKTTSGSTVAAQVNVGAASGPASALEFSSINEGTLEGGIIAVGTTGKVIINPQSSLRITQAAKITGATATTDGRGSVEIKAGGSVNLAQKLTLEIDATVAGSVVFFPGIPATVAGVTCSDTSAIAFQASQTGFTPIQATGAVVFKGAVSVDLGKFTTTTPVLLLHAAGGISGRFDTAKFTKEAANSVIHIQGAAAPFKPQVNAKGYVIYNYDEGNLYYDPNANANTQPRVSAAAQLVPSSLAVLAAACLALVVARRA